MNRPVDKQEPASEHHRRNVLMVGTSPLLDAAAHQLSPMPRRVEDVYEAVAIVATAPGSNSPGAVVLAGDQLNGAAESVRRAFAQIDPSLRLIALFDSHAPANVIRQLSGMFDACLTADESGRISPQLLAQAIDSDAAAPPSQTAAPVPQQPDSRPAPQPNAAPIETPAPRAARDDLAEVNDMELAMPPLHERHLASPSFPPFSESMPVAAAPLPAGLGDVDLVEAILNDPQGVSHVAMQLLQQQTGWSDLRREPALAHAHPSTSGDTSGGASAPITFRDASFGHLVSERATAAQLRPWADWLARWLALDRAHRDFRLLAYQDDLTGAWNRRCFNRFLSDAIDRARAARRPVTVMVYDLDHFKTYNDTFGHDAGDDILRETVKLLNSVIRKGDRVFRIGGDEFAVVFADPEKPREPGSMHPDTVERIARRFQDQVCRMKFPKLGAEAPGTLSISAGLATYPWDGSDAESLLRHADQLALQSKQRGKNAITFGPGAQQMCGG